MGEGTLLARKGGGASLPPGQHHRSDFPRFGLPRYANRVPNVVGAWTLDLGGDAVVPVPLDHVALQSLPRTDQVSDFHCVTTWTFSGARWSGFRFSDVYEQLVALRLRPGAVIGTVVFRCLDGYRTALPLDDLLAQDVLLADRLAESPSCVTHGAPLRLVAPAHYGYKNAKHLKAIEFWSDPQKYRKAGLGHFMDHPRARVAREERARGVPGWMLRWVYRLTIPSNVRRFHRGFHLPGAG